MPSDIFNVTETSINLEGHKSFRNSDFSHTLAIKCRISFLIIKSSFGKDFFAQSRFRLNYFIKSVIERHSIKCRHLNVTCRVAKSIWDMIHRNEEGDIGIEFYWNNRWLYWIKIIQGCFNSNMETCVNCLFSIFLKFKPHRI